MHTIADFCVIPMGVTASVSQYIAECQRVIEKSGLTHSMHSYGTRHGWAWSDKGATDSRVCLVDVQRHSIVLMGLLLLISWTHNKLMNLDP
ncbi:hypothetical protein BGZ95_008096 [Linnemannia exigua]|uniref:Thiamine-binding protein domain-containing protein n=1 Tax=Linnemannia exigua TaxID=604196 RepID=A0AAD4DEH1_9FUNG|nr:hypothetical protein BGZ95_008096 [Linnemannia exigua]